MRATQNVNILGITPLVSPRKVRDEYPSTESIIDTVLSGRETVKAILRGDDRRFMAIIGPCSIHNEQSALEYANRLSELAKRVSDRLFIVMRVYFEKPRTTVGWKGLINDPHMDDSFDIPEGIRRARHILRAINQLGLPTGTEMLEPVTPQYIADLVSWASIGARTTESPTHRQMASGLSMPVGFKNGTDGSVEIAVNAMQSCSASHHFLGIDEDGMTCVVKTRGNADSHLILRGGRGGTNYDAGSIRAASSQLAAARLNSGVIVDCSHANSEKDHRRQDPVWHDVVEVAANNEAPVIGAMLESNLFEGNQKLTSDVKALRYGVSITDACIGWEKTEELVLWAHDRLASRQPAASGV